LLWNFCKDASELDFWNFGVWELLGELIKEAAVGELARLEPLLNCGVPLLRELGQLG